MSLTIDILREKLIGVKNEDLIKFLSDEFQLNETANVDTLKYNVNLLKELDDIEKQILLAKLSSLKVPYDITNKQVATLVAMIASIISSYGLVMGDAMGKLLVGIVSLVAFTTFFCYITFNVGLSNSNKEIITYFEELLRK